MNNSVKAYISILSVCIFWGYSFISTKICLNWFTPFSLAFFRAFIASIILFIALKISERDIRVPKKDLPRFVLCGFFGVFLYFAFENLSIKMLSASLASIFLALLPAFAIFTDFFILHKKLTKAKIISVALSIFGAILVAGFNAGDGSSNLFLGIILVMLSLAAWIAFSYISIPLQDKYSPLKITFYQSLFGALFFLFTLPFSPPNFEGFTTAGACNMLFLGVICSAVCYLLYNYALKYVSIVVSSIFINLMPIVTIIASMLLLGERINFVQAIGAVIIIGSVFIATKNESKCEKPE